MKSDKFKKLYKEHLIKKRKKLCAWYYNKHCMADSGGWGTVTCHGNCQWIEDYEKELDEIEQKQHDRQRSDTTEAGG